MNSEDKKILRKLIPLESFPSSAFDELCTNIVVEQAQDARIITRGDKAPDLIYLLTGTVSLQADEMVVEVIEAGSESARFALAHQIPRKIDVLANGFVRFVRLNPDIVNNRPPIEIKEDDSYTIQEDSDMEADDWLNVFLRMPLFQNFPPANLQKLLISLKTTHYNEGDMIVDAGNEVSMFSIISKGQCVASRPGVAGNVERKLSPGETFGEDCLILGSFSKERIKAITATTLIQLDRNQFVALITKPCIRNISAEEMAVQINEGAMLLDVRSKHLAERQPLDTGVNIPYINLPNKVKDLDKNRRIIAYGDERTSQAAAFLLLKHNFNVCAMSDGSIFSEPEPETSEINAEEAKNIEEFQEMLKATFPEEMQEPNVDPVSEEPDDEMHEEANGNQNGQVMPKTLNPDAELRFLRAENQRLTAYNNHLQDKLLKLKMEHQKLVMRSKLLALQLKKLKEFLVKYKGK